jgi:hypothetical protein
MRTSVQTFRAGVEELLIFLSSMANETELIGLLLQRQSILNSHESQVLTQIAAARTDRKRYTYIVSIVSLYGLLERFIETLIEAFIENIASAVNSYNRMPAKIRDNHIPNSIALLKAIGEERHRTRTTQEEVIANLYSCLSGDTNFRMNGAAFVLHRGNINLARITEHLSSVGINTHFRRVILAPDLISFFRERDPERDIRNVADQDLYALLQPIDDLVERRNQVSHGVIDIDDIESIDLLKERCHFVAAYGNAVYNVVAQEVLKYQIDRANVQRLGKPIKVYNNSIVCFEANNTRIAVGNTIAAATSNTLEPFFYSEIVNLQINGKNISEIVSSESATFGAEVSFKASEKYDYFVLHDKVI